MRDGSQHPIDIGVMTAIYRSDFQAFGPHLIVGGTVRCHHGGAGKLLAKLSQFFRVEQFEIDNCCLGSHFCNGVSEFGSGMC